jgi:hypothetical protein
MREGVESQGVAAIETWYKVAREAPILQDDRIHGNFGFLENTVLADKVLQGHISTPRTWIHIPNTCYRRHNTSSTDCQRKR